MKKLPQAGSSARLTSFCHARIDGPGGLHLFADGNGKITRDNGTLTEPRPNAFSLPAAGLSGMEHCPQSTETCRKACYVEGLNKAQPELYATYEHNATTIRAILMDDELGSAWVMRFAEWCTESAPGGFRWHVSGDVFSADYAQWIADVCAESPGVQHWIYTRSFEYLEPLVRQSTLCGGNLAINLSADADNYDDALEASVRAPIRWGASKSLRICYLTVDGTVPDGLHDSDVIFPTYELRPQQFATLAESPWWASLTPQQRGLVCPVDAHGKSEVRRCGPCARCLT